MALRDVLETAGNTVASMGLPTRGRSSPLATGISSALYGFAQGSEARRKRAALGEESRMRSEVEGKIGVPYDFFLKLSNEAQEEILRNSGILAKPAAEEVIPEFGVTPSRLKQYGAPGREATVPGGSGVFSDLPATGVQVGPPMPPTEKLSGNSYLQAYNAYLGQEPGVDPNVQSQMDARTQRMGLDERRTNAYIKSLEALTGYRKATTEKVVKGGEKKGEEIVSDFMVEKAKQMGIALPDGPITQKVLDQASKFNKPGNVMLNKAIQVARDIADTEKAGGEELDEETLDDEIGSKSVEAKALIDTEGFKVDPNLFGQLVKAELARIRAKQSEERLYNPAPALGTGVPSPYPFSTEDDEE